MIALDELLDVPAGGTIRIARPGSDGIKRFAEHVAEHDGQHMRGRAALGKAAALDGGKMLADGGDFHDIRAAFQCLIEKVSRFRAPGKSQRCLGMFIKEILQVCYGRAKGSGAY